MTELTKLHKDTKLYFVSGMDVKIITQEELSHEIEKFREKYEDGEPEVFVALETTSEASDFNIISLVEKLGRDSWSSFYNVANAAIKTWTDEDFESFTNDLNAVFAKHPVYIIGEEVNIKPYLQVA